MSATENIQKQIDEQQTALDAARAETRSDDFNPDNADGQKTLAAIESASGKIAVLGQQKKAAEQTDAYYDALDSHTDDIFKANGWNRGPQESPTEEFKAYRQLVHELAAKYPGGRPPTDSIGVLARDAAAAVKEKLSAADDKPADSKKGKKDAKKAKADKSKEEKGKDGDKDAEKDGDKDEAAAAASEETPPGEDGIFPDKIGKDGKPITAEGEAKTPGMATATFNPESLVDPEASAGGGDDWGSTKGLALLRDGISELHAAAGAEVEAGNISEGIYSQPHITIGGGE